MMADWMYAAATRFFGGIYMHKDAPDAEKSCLWERASHARVLTSIYIDVHTSISLLRARSST